MAFPAMNIGAYEASTSGVEWYTNIGADHAEDAIEYIDASSTLTAEVDITANGAALYPLEASATVTTEVDISAVASSPEVLDGVATITADVSIDASALVLDLILLASSTVTADVSISANGYLRTQVAGAQIADKRRMLAIGNDELWYEDI